MTWDRAAESVGNAVELGHVNLRVPDQRLATAFYVSALGLTRDPYLVTGVENMWVNVGRAQFHLPTGAPQVLRGTVGVVLPDRAALLERLATARRWLGDSAYAFEEHADHVAVTCPWGNRLRCHAPDPARFGRMALGLPYVEFAVPQGTLPGIARCYAQLVGLPTETDADAVRVRVAADAELRFVEHDAPLPAFDGHHVQITLADFAGPYDRLRERGLISREDSALQWRFTDLMDPESGRVLFQIEHEVRSTTHPLFGRTLVNRNPAVTNQRYAPGHEALAPTLPP